MELRDYVAVLRKYWVSIVVLTVLGLVGATIVTLVTPPTYTAQSAVFLAVRGATRHRNWRRAPRTPPTRCVRTPRWRRHRPCYSR